MLRKILSTTAIVSILSAGVVYADSSNNAAVPPAGNAAAAPMKADGQPIFPEMQDNDALEAFFGADDSQVLASALLGWPVYSASSADGEMEQVGDINDIVMSSSGHADAVVVGVGGFLGMGEKNVAVPFDRLTWKQSEDGNWLSIDASREELENAPEFDTESAHFLRVGAINTEALTNSASETAGRVGNAADNVYDSMSSGLSGLADSATDEMKKAGEEINKAGENMKQSFDQSENIDSPILDGMRPIDLTDANFAEIEGAPVLSADGKRVGDVSEVVTYGDQTQHVLIVDVGGFLGIGEKPVAVSADAVSLMSNGHDYLVQTGFDRETLENHEAYSEEKLASDPDSVMLN